MQAAIDGSFRFKTVRERLLLNQAHIARWVDQKYPGTYEAVHKLLVEHIAIAEQITLILLKKGDPNREMQEWYRNADDISDAFHGVNPNLRLHKHMKLHLDTTAAELTALLKGSDAIAEYDQVIEHIVQLHRELTK